MNLTSSHTSFGFFVDQSSQLALFLTLSRIIGNLTQGVSGKEVRGLPLPALDQILLQVPLSLGTRELGTKLI
jgi:hypothetical protein